MNDETITNILSTLKSIDKKAENIYLGFAASAEKKELKQFWRKMASEEHRHVDFWMELLDLAQAGAIPQILDDAETVNKELANTDVQSDMLVAKSKEAPDIFSQFLLAYRMEFYLLHPAFEQFFYFAKILPREMSPLEDYEHHIERFIKSLQSFAITTPEMDLLGETLRKLWGANKKLAVQGLIDPLTEVYSRLGFFRSAKMLAHIAFRNESNVAIIMADIDFFKSINDTYGHQAGDSVLKRIGKLLEDSVRGSDLVGRYGGEEFIVILYNITSENLLTVCEKLRLAVEGGTKGEHQVTISVGAALSSVVSDPDAVLDQLISHSDSMLYNAKEQGRNRIVIYE